MLKIKACKLLYCKNISLFERFYLVKSQIKTIITPIELAKKDQIPFLKDELNLKFKNNATEELKVNNENISNKINYSNFNQKIGQWIISFFHIDMDKVRASKIGGTIYFNECVNKGYLWNENLDSDFQNYFYNVLELPQTFNQWFQISILHYWMLNVRMRALPKTYSRLYQQTLIDMIFKDIELKMAEKLKIKSNKMLDNNLKQFHSQLLGSILSYDVGLVDGDANLSTALWRNIFNSKNTDIRYLESLVCYVRSQIYLLSKTTDREFGFGNFLFVSPNKIISLITESQEKELKKLSKIKFSQNTNSSAKSNLSLDE